MSIKTELINGVFWSAVQKYSGLVFQLLITAILARLLSPEDFGIVAVASVLISFFSLFSDLGIASAIVQNKELTQKDYDSIFTFSIWLGILLAGFFFLASTPISLFYEERALERICRLLSINLLFSAWVMVPNALIMKNKEFKFIAKRTLLLQVVCGLLSIFSAYLGAGLYALIISPVLTSIGVYVMSFRRYPQKFLWCFDRTSLHKIFSFSVFQFLFGFINYFSRNLDKLIIGRHFSMNELGYYEKSYRLMLLPLQNLTFVITPVMHPILSTLQHDYDDMTVKYNKILKLLATIGFPLGVLLYFTAADLIYLIFGSQWSQSVPVFQILSLSIPFQLLLSTSGSIYQAANRTNWLFYTGLINTTLTVLGFLVAAVQFRTIEAMAWAWDLTLWVNFFLVYTILYKIVLKQCSIPVYRICVLPICNAAILFLAFTFWSPDYSPVINLFLMTAFTFIISLLFIQITKQYNLANVYAAIKRIVSR